MAEVNEATKKVSSTQNYGKRMPLPNNPLKSDDLGYLEKILEACEGFKYLNVLHPSCSWGKPFGRPSLTDQDSMGTYLPGESVIRARYSVADIKDRYETLSKL